MIRNPYICDFKNSPKEYDLWLNRNFLILELEKIRSLNRQIKFRNKSIFKFAKFSFVVKAHCNLMCENTWFFETREQANSAFEMFKNTELDGWFYSIDELDFTIQNYFEKFEIKPRIDYF